MGSLRGGALGAVLRALWIYGLGVFSLHGVRFHLHGGYGVDAIYMGQGPSYHVNLSIRHVNQLSTWAYMGLGTFTM